MNNAPAVLSALAVVLADGGCSAPLERDEVETLGAPIVGGVETPPCAWPTTVAFSQNGAGCTATLIHPKMITVADHCLSGSGGSVSLGDARGGKAAVRTVSIQKCYARNIDNGEDFAVCVLAQEINDIPVIPVLFGCETAILKAGQEVALVGYGNISANTPSPGNHKRWTMAKVNRINSGMKSIDIGDPMHQNCFGDSGGPAFVKLADGTWRVFGVTSTTNSPACASQGTWALTPTYVPWVEQQTGLDVTPCHDAATGKWEGGPTCQGFPLNPEVALGTWANGCTENLMRSGPGMTCGAGTDAGLPMRDAQPDNGTTGVGGSGGTGGPDGGGGGRGGGGSGGTGGAGGTSGGSGGAGGSSGNGGGNAGSVGSAGAMTSTGGSTMATGGTGGTIGGAAGGGQAGSGHVSTSSSGTGPPAPDTIEGGCACRFGAGHDQGRGAALGLLLFAGALGRRRRGRS